MTRHRLMIKYNLCFGCYACEVACKQENGLPVGLKWISVTTKGPAMVDGKLTMDFIPVACRHCLKAPCQSVCPEDAITHHQNGAVVISKEKCNGCLACLIACPFDAIEFDPEKNTVEKCHLCTHRLNNDLQPACAQACPAEAITYIK